MNLADMTDGKLLAEFFDRKSQAAFQALVDRHGHMVLGVCRRVTGCPHDAEDAAQAAFTALARRAGELRTRRSVAGWLHRAAWHTSLRTRRASSANARRERQGVESDGNDAVVGAPGGPHEWQPELLAAEARLELDRALGLLRDKYREALVLHHLEGMTVAQVAELLACPPGTVAAHLSRGRSILKEHLERRGLAAFAAAEAVAAMFPDRLGPAKASHTASASGAARRLRPILPPAPVLPGRTATGGVVAADTAAAGAAASAGPAGAGAGSPWLALWSLVRRPSAVSLVLAGCTVTAGAAGVAGYKTIVAEPDTPVAAEVSAPSSEAGPALPLSFPSSGGASAAVPEPSCLALLAVGGLALLSRRRRPATGEGRP
jgi:RNA polymerase sigma factor (sigma-70 family)